MRVRLEAGEKRMGVDHLSITEDRAPGWTTDGASGCVGSPPVNQIKVNGTGVVVFKGSQLVGG